MSQVAEAVRSAYAAFGAGDVENVLSIFAPTIRWVEAEGGPYGGVFIGPQQVVENVFMKLGSEWDGFTVTPHEFIANDDTVVAFGEYGGRFIATGRSLKAPFAHVWKFRDGKVISFQQYTDTALLWRALGRS